MDDDMRELSALLGYLVKHNTEHASEITALAERAKSLGKTAVYDGLVKGVDLLNGSNDCLKAALAALEA
jgi:hypothetical protein